MTDAALVHLVPTGKKGLNLWLNAIPVPASIIIFNHYGQACREHMGIYSLRTSENGDPAGLQALAELELPPEWGSICLSCAVLILISCAPPWISNLDWEIRLPTLPFAVRRGADLSVLIIEFIIPADKHAVRPPAPPTPPVLSAPSEPNPKVDPQLTSATRDAAPKGGGLLQSFGITGGMQDDHVTAATFLETGTLHVHLARGRSNWEACVRCPSAALRPDVMIVHASRALTGECDGAKTGRPQW